MNSPHHELIGTIEPPAENDMLSFDQKGVLVCKFRKPLDLANLIALLGESGFIPEIYDLVVRSAQKRFRIMRGVAARVERSVSESELFAPAHNTPTIHQNGVSRGSLSMQRSLCWI